MVDSGVVALVERVKESRKGSKIMLRVLSGSLHDGDEIELVRADGYRKIARITDLGSQPLTPDSTLIKFVGGVAEGTWHHQDSSATGLFFEGDLIRAPGAESVPAPPESGTILADIRAARAEGSMPQGGHLPDSVIALHLLHCTESAVRFSQGALTTSAQYLALARTLDGYGLVEQADRARLVAAAVVEGYDPGPSARGLASIAAGVLNVPTGFKSPMLVQGFALAMEEGDTFVKSYQKGVRGSGEGIRRPLQLEGRAVGLAWCKTCRTVRQVDVHMKCATCGKKVKGDLERVVIPADLPEALADLRLIHGV